MDADWIDSPRESLLYRRERRWSMNSQRLETILAQLMKPISTDNRRSFDTDQSALLEEYLTEAGLRVLAAAEVEEEAAAAEVEEEAAAAEVEEEAALARELPNFAEVALVLQQSVACYSRKVDALYDRVVQVCAAIHHHAAEASAQDAAASPPSPPAGRRRRPPSAPLLADFAEIEVERCAAATREAGSVRPPPTLPRLYAELEPRVPGAADMPLSDYALDHIGLLTDFQVTWRLHDGLLVDELEGASSGSAGPQAAPRALSLLELQAAVEARAPPSPPPPAPSPPPHRSTPLPPPPPPAPRNHRKRLSAVHVDQLFTHTHNITLSKDVKTKLRKVQEFSIDKLWIETVVKKRKSNILRERKRLLQETPPDVAWAGWSARDAARAHAATLALRDACADLDSDDDGFFEQSGDDDELPPAPRRPPPPPPAPAPALAAWRAEMARRVAEAEARGAPDVRALAERVLGALGPGAARPLGGVLRREARHPTDVSRLVLAALFLANAGNVELERGAPLSLNACALRLVSRDTSQFAQAAAAHAHCS